MTNSGGHYLGDDRMMPLLAELNRARSRGAAASDIRGTP